MDQKTPARERNSRAHIAALLQDPTPVTWVFAGDSITHGAFHTFGYRDYTELFSERVRWELGRGRDCVIKTGVSGWRIANISEDLAWSVQHHSPHIVSLNVGMNDCTAGLDGLSPFVATYRRVLDDIIARTHAALILHVPNPIVAASDPSRQHLPVYAEAVRKIAADYEAVLVDHERHWLRDSGSRPLSYWLTDAIHPNFYGHRRLARLLLQELSLFDSASLTCGLFAP